jgi:hypothetical protein
MIVGSIGDYWKEAKSERTTPRARTKKYSLRITKTEALYLTSALDSLIYSEEEGKKHNKLLRKLQDIYRINTL